MTDVVATVAAVRERVAAARAEGKSIGLLTTMGALHEGHLSLVSKAREECGFVVVSVFVNPTQFAPGTDFEKYPRDLDGDAVKVGAVGADVVFAPSVEEMYPAGDSTFVEVTGPLVEVLCGPHRPGHFRGVTTVCARLFNIVGADRVYFGEKDHQQLLVIKQMVRDLKMPLEVIPAPTVREADGLAMSSRNAYLSAEDRKAAAALSRGLFAARERFEAGERDASALVAEAKRIIAGEPRVKVQYLDLRDGETLAEVQTVKRPAVLAVAAFVGEARLIDNVVVG